MNRFGYVSAMPVTPNPAEQVRTVVVSDARGIREESLVYLQQSTSRLSLTGKRLLIFSRILPPPGSTEAV